MSQVLHFGRVSVIVDAITGKRETERILCAEKYYCINGYRLSFRFASDRLSYCTFFSFVVRLAHEYLEYLTTKLPP